MEGKKLRNIKLTLAYDGTGYHGFQRQDNAVAVQNVLEAKLSGLFGDTVNLVASGRTDTGVHALGQVVSFKTASLIPTERIVNAANDLLPRDISICSAEEVEDDFHARFSAVAKTYLYRIDQRAIRDPFQRYYVWYIKKHLDVALMDEALQTIVGTHDFSAFCAAGGITKNPIRTLYKASCEQCGDILEVVFYGNGFLYHMVRNIVGTLVDVGKYRITPLRFAAILAGKDRTKAGATAPPGGLYLKAVEYS